MQTFKQPDSTITVKVCEKRHKICHMPCCGKLHSKLTKKLDVGCTSTLTILHRRDVDCVWNVMAHACVNRSLLSMKRTSPFKSAEVSVQSTGNRDVRISGSNAGYIMYRSRMKSTGYPPGWPVSPSLLLQCFTVCHHISTGLYHTVRHDVIVDWFNLQYALVKTSRFYQIKGVSLATETGISLIILNLNRSTFVVWEMKRNVSIVCLCSAPNCCDKEQRFVNQPACY